MSMKSSSLMFRNLRITSEIIALAKVVKKVFGCTMSIEKYFERMNKKCFQRKISLGTTSSLIKSSWRRLEAEGPNSRPLKRREKRAKFLYLAATSSSFIKFLPSVSSSDWLTNSPSGHKKPEIKNWVPATCPFSVPRLPQAPPNFSTNISRDVTDNL